MGRKSEVTSGEKSAKTQAKTKAPVQARGVKTRRAESNSAAHKQAEEKIRQNEENFRSIFEGTHIGICLVAPDGKFIRVNNTMCEIFGYTQTE